MITRWYYLAYPYLPTILENGTILLRWDISNIVGQLFSLSVASSEVVMFLSTYLLVAKKYRFYIVVSIWSETTIWLLLSFFYCFFRLYIIKAVISSVYELFCFFRCTEKKIKNWRTRVAEFVSFILSPSLERFQYTILKNTCWEKNKIEIIYFSRWIVSSLSREMNYVTHIKMKNELKKKWASIFHYVIFILSVIGIYWIIELREVF